MWISDVHRINTYAGYKWYSTVNLINQISPDFVIDSGDLTTDATTSQFESYLSEAYRMNPTLYSVPGNHDAAASGGYLSDFTTYLSYGLPQHFTVDIGNFRIIGFTSYQQDGVIAAEAFVEAGEKAWVLNELQNLDGKTPILTTHYRGSFIAAGGTWNTFWDDLETYGVKGLLSGHDHAYCSTVTVQGCINVFGASVWGSNGGDPTIGGLMIWYVFSDRMELQFIRSVFPNEELTTGTTPTYSKVTITR